MRAVPADVVRGNGSEAGTPSQDAIELAVDICTDGWQQTFASRVADLVDDETWRFKIGNKGRVSCRRLAEVARALLGFKGTVQDSAADIADSIMKRGGASLLARRLARALIKKAPVPGTTELKHAARGLQLLGVYVCAVQGKGFTECVCLHDLARAVAKQQLEGLLKHHLDSLVGEPTRQMQS